MNIHKMKILSLLFLFALCTLKSFAEGNYTFVLNFSITAQMQDTNVITTSAMTFVPVFVNNHITTKTLLQLLAQDEFAEGHYPSNSFPNGARLLFFTNPTSFTNSYYMATDKDGNQLVDVTDLLTFQPQNDVSAYSYKSANSTGIYNPFLREYIGVTSFDDTSTNAGGTTKFTLEQTIEITVIQKISKNVLTESAATKFSTGMGTATFNGRAAVLSSSAMSANSPKFTFTLQ